MTVFVTITAGGDVPLDETGWARFVNAVDREVRQLATAVLGAWASHPGDRVYTGCWRIEVPPKDRALLRGLLVGVGWQFRQDIEWTEASSAAVLR